MMGDERYKEGGMRDGVSFVGSDRRDGFGVVFFASLGKGIKEFKRAMSGEDEPTRGETEAEKK